MAARWRVYRVYDKLIILLCFMTDVLSLRPPSHRIQARIQEHIDEESRVASLLLKNYEKRFIPTLHGQPLDVNLNVVVADILSIDNMVAEMLLYVRQSWYDYRLSRNSTKMLKIREHFVDKIWLPDVRLVNLIDAKKFHEFGGVNMNIYPDGKVYFSQSLLVKTSCPMDLHRFPLDQQTCFLNFSTFAYSKKWLNYTTAGEHVVIKHTKLPQFNLVKTKEVEGVGKAPGVSISLTFQRRFGYYLMQMYIPSASIVALSWLAFFMESSNIADRLALEITLTLTTVFLMNGVNEEIPHVSYAKASDVFVIVSFGFIFMALLETMLVFRLSILLRKHRMTHCFCGVWGCYNVAQSNEQIHVSQEDDDSDKPEPDVKSAEMKCHCTSLATWIDKICIMLFPTMYITFNIVYWKYYTSNLILS